MNSPVSQNPLIRLRQILDTHFDESELRTLCFDLQVDYDNLLGSGKADKARELVAYCKRHDRIRDLIEVGRQHRPGIDWAIEFVTMGRNIDHVLEASNGTQTVILPKVDDAEPAAGDPRPLTSSSSNSFFTATSQVARSQENLEQTTTKTSSKHKSDNSSGFSFNEKIEVATVEGIICAALGAIWGGIWGSSTARDVGQGAAIMGILLAIISAGAGFVIGNRKKGWFLGIGYEFIGIFVGGFCGIILGAISGVVLSIFGIHDTLGGAAGGIILGTITAIAVTALS